MGNEASAVVSEFLDYEDFPHSLRKKVAKKFAKALRHADKGRLDELQGGDTTDPGRNEQVILQLLPADVRRDAVVFLYNSFFDKCHYYQPLRISIDAYTFQQFAVEIALHTRRLLVRAGELVLSSEDSTDALYFVRRGQVEVRARCCCTRAALRAVDAPRRVRSTTPTCGGSPRTCPAGARSRSA